MKNKPLRIIVMIITFFLGFISSSFYLIGEIVHVAKAKSLEGYFNAWGMTFVVLAFIIVITNIQSLVYNIKILSYSYSQPNSELLDESTTTNIGLPWRLPSKFLLTCNLIFGVTFFLNGLLLLFHSLLVKNKGEMNSFSLIICLLIIVCGSYVTYDVLKMKRVIIF